MDRNIFALLCALFGAGILAASAAAEPPLTCTPARIDAETKELTLAFAGPHGRSLSVVNPVRGSFFLAGGPIPAPGGLEGFADARTVTIDPRTVEGYLHAAQGRWERPFTDPGVYEFRVANQLQTDADPPDDPMLTCRVEFVGEAPR